MPSIRLTCPAPFAFMATTIDFTELICLILSPVLHAELPHAVLLCLSSHSFAEEQTVCGHTESVRRTGPRLFRASTCALPAQEGTCTQVWAQARHCRGSSPTSLCIQEVVKSMLALEPCLHAKAGVILLLVSDLQSCPRSKGGMFSMCHVQVPVPCK